MCKKKIQPIKNIGICFYTLQTTIFLASLLMLNSTAYSASRNFEKSDTYIEEILVTAQKRLEKLQSVPVSIFRYSQDSLIKSGAGNFTDVAGSTPGVTLAKTGVGGARFFIRGAGQVTVNQAPTTGVYLDETPLQIRTSFGVAQVDPRLFDVKSIEVLRGPQGSLFGSSSTGGAVRIITHEPNVKEFETTLNLTGSSTKDGGDNKTIAGIINIPFTEQMAGLRIAALYDDQGGFIDDLRPTTNDIFENAANPIEDINTNQSDALHASFKISPNNLLTLTSSLFYQNQHSNQQRQEVDLTFDLNAEERTVARYMDTFTDDETSIFSLKAEFDLDIFNGVSVVSATSYMDREVGGVFDLSPFSNGGIESAFPKPAPFENRRFVVGLFSDNALEQITQELRATSTADTAAQYIVGFFYKNVAHTTSGDRRVLNTYATALDPVLRESTNKFDEQEFALFGEFSYQFTDQIKGVVGGRFFRFDQRESRRQFGVGGAARGTQDFGFTEKSDESGFSPRALVSYTPKEDLHVYLSYAEGFRSGGINAPIVDAVCSPAARALFNIPDVPNPYESDTAKSTELGVKLKFFDSRLSIYAAGYNTDWADFQLSVQQDCGPTSGVAVFTANAGDVDIDGFELEISAYPMDYLRISAGYGYTDATFAGSNNGALQARGIKKGMRLFDVAEHNWNVQAELTVPLSPQAHAYIFLTSHFVDESFSGFGEGEAPRRPDYTLTNLRAGISTARWDLSLFANNLTDETAIYGLEFASSPTNTTASNDFAAFVGQPRVIGLQLQTHF